MQEELQLCLLWGEANHKRLASISTSPVAPALVGRRALGPEELERWWEVRIHSQEAGVLGSPHLSSTGLSPHPFLSTPSLPLLLPSLDLLSVDPVPSSFFLSPFSVCLFSIFLPSFSSCPPSTVFSSLPSLFLPSFLFPGFPPFLSISFSHSFFSFTFLNFSLFSCPLLLLSSLLLLCVCFPFLSCFSSLLSYNKQILLLHSDFYNCSFISSLFPAPSRVPSSALTTGALSNLLFPHQSFCCSQGFFQSFVQFPQPPFHLPLFINPLSEQAEGINVPPPQVRALSCISLPTLHTILSQLPSMRGSVSRAPR